MAAVKMAPPAHISYEEFLNTDYGELRVEWVDGRIEQMGTVSTAHALGRVPYFAARSPGRN